MSLRIFSGATLLLLASCGGSPERVASGNTQQARGDRPAEAAPEHIACAVGGGDYADVCTIDRIATADGAVMTIRHPDGGFRRLHVAPDGGVTAADGALPAQVLERSDKGIEVAVGDARYRLPRTP